MACFVADLLSIATEQILWSEMEQRSLTIWLQSQPHTNPCSDNARQLDKESSHYDIGPVKKFWTRIKVFNDTNVLQRLILNVQRTLTRTSWCDGSFVPANLLRFMRNRLMECIAINGWLSRNWYGILVMSRDEFDSYRSFKKRVFAITLATIIKQLKI